MFDIRKVEQLSRLPKAKVLLIMSHYAEYKERWAAAK